MNILIADDDPGCCCLLQEVLSSLPGLSIITAGNGAEAWWWLTTPRMQYAFAILDIHMPQVDGISLLARMRETPRFKVLPVIMCTGILERNLIGKARNLAVNHYLIKPFSPETLLEKVEEIMPHTGRQYVIV